MFISVVSIHRFIGLFCTDIGYGADFITVDFTNGVTNGERVDGKLPCTAGLDDHIQGRIAAGNNSSVGFSRSEFINAADHRHDQYDNDNEDQYADFPE